MANRRTNRAPGGTMTRKSVEYSEPHAKRRSAHSSGILASVGPAGTAYVGTAVALATRAGGATSRQRTLNVSPPTVNGCGTNGSEFGFVTNGGSSGVASL